MSGSKAALRHPCPLCEATGTVGGVGLGIMTLGGTTCSFCAGRCYLPRKAHACARCEGEGARREAWDVLKTECRSCHGLKWTRRKLRRCCKCEGSGKTGGVLSKGPCLACDTAGWVLGRQGPCIVCEGRGKLGGVLGFGATSCYGCDGAGLRAGRQGSAGAGGQGGAPLLHNYFTITSKLPRRYFTVISAPFRRYFPARPTVPHSSPAPAP